MTVNNDEGASQLQASSIQGMPSESGHIHSKQPVFLQRTLLEIEFVLSQHLAVKQVLAMAREDVPGDKQLVAYVVLHENQSATAGELQQYAMKQLTHYLLPTAFVFLETLPLTPDNKVDLSRLQVPDQTHRNKVYDAPRTLLEETVANTWTQVLKIERIGIHDDFFALGGHSLLAMQILSKLRAILQVDVPLSNFFEAPTVAQLTEIIEQLKANSTKSSPLPLSARDRAAYRVPATPKSGSSQLINKE